MFSLLFQTSREIRRNFKLDLIGSILFGLFFGGVNSFLLVQARRIGATPFEVGILAALPNIWMLLSPVWARLFRDCSPFYLVLTADGFSRLMLVFLVVNRSPRWYLSVFTVHYFFASISATIYGKAMRQAYTPEIRGTLMGWVRVGSALAQIISTAVAGILLPVMGVQPLFAMLAVFGIFSAITFGRLRQAVFESPAAAPKNSSAFQVFRGDSQYRRYMIALFFFGLAVTLSLPAYPLYQVDQLKVSDSFVSLFWMIISLAALIFYFLAGRWIDRYSPIKLSFFVFVANLAIPIIYLCSGNQWPLLLVAVLQGIVNAGIDLAALNCVIRMAKEGEINSYMAVHIYLLGVRGTLGPLLAPFLIQLLSFKGFFILIVLLTLAGVWILRPLIKEKPSLVCDDQILTAGGTK